MHAPIKRPTFKATARPLYVKGAPREVLLAIVGVATITHYVGYFAGLVPWQSLAAGVAMGVTVLGAAREALRRDPAYFAIFAKSWNAPSRYDAAKREPQEVWLV